LVPPVGAGLVRVTLLSVESPSLWYARRKTRLVLFITSAQGLLLFLVVLAVVARGAIPVLA
jgi:hypothetical protein